MAGRSYDFTVSIGGRVASSLGGAVRAAQRSLGGLSRDLRAAQEVNRTRRGQARAQLFDAAALGGSLYGLIRPAVEFESAMADVRKLVTFDAPEQFGQMGRDILLLSRRLPIAAEGLAAIVAAGGGAGLPREELLGFAESAAMMATSFGITAEAAGRSMANLRNSLLLSQPQVVLLADAINELGDKSAAHESDILEFTRRLGGLARTAHLAGPQLAAFGSAMMASGAEPERAATSMQHVLLALSAGTSATKKQKEAFRALGLSSTAMSRRMMRDAPGAITTVFERLSQLSEHRRIPVMKELFGEEGLQALAPMLSNLGELRRLLALVAQESNYAGSATRQFGISSETTTNRLGLFRNRIKELGITLGDVFLPTLNDALGVLGPFGTRLSELAKRHPLVTKAIVGTTMGLVALRVAAIGASYAWVLMKGGAITAARGVVGAAGLMGRAVLVAFAPIRMVGGLAMAAARRVRTALILMQISSVSTGRAIGITMAMTGRSILALLSPIRLVRGALVAMRVAMLGTGIGAALVALGAGAAWVYNNFDKLTVAARGFGAGFMRAFGPLRPEANGLAGALARAWRWFKDLIGPTQTSEEAFRKFGERIGELVGEKLKSLIETIDRWKGLATTVAVLMGGLWAINAVVFAARITGIAGAFGLMAKAARAATAAAATATGAGVAAGAAGAGAGAAAGAAGAGAGAAAAGAGAAGAGAGAAARAAGAGAAAAGAGAAGAGAGAAAGAAGAGAAAAGAGAAGAGWLARLGVLARVAGFGLRVGGIGAIASAMIELPAMLGGMLNRNPVGQDLQRRRWRDRALLGTPLPEQTPAWTESWGALGRSLSERFGGGGATDRSTEQQQRSRRWGERALMSEAPQSEQAPAWAGSWGALGNGLVEVMREAEASRREARDAGRESRQERQRETRPAFNTNFTFHVAGNADVDEIRRVVQEQMDRIVARAESEQRARLSD